jgi:hypothetical protein
LWIVLTAAWIATIAGIDRPDKQIALARQPILISWSQEPYAVATIEFPAEIDQGTIAKAINNWIAELNVILVKLRTGLTLSSLSDEELRTLASRLGLDDKRSISDIRRQIADRMRMTDLPPLPPGFVLDTPPSVPPLVLDGDELAAKAIAQRPPGVSTVATRFLGLALGPPVALLLVAAVITWVLAGFRLNGPARH